MNNYNFSIDVSWEYHVSEWMTQCLQRQSCHSCAPWGVYELRAKHVGQEYNYTEDYILEIWSGVWTLSVIGEEILIRSRDSGGQLSSLAGRVVNTQNHWSLALQRTTQHCVGLSYFTVKFCFLHNTEKPPVGSDKELKSKSELTFLCRALLKEVFRSFHGVPKWFHLMWEYTNTQLQVCLWSI